MNEIQVIIAEDDAKIAEIQKRFLERIHGFELIGIAHDLSETEDLVDVLNPDLLLLDIQFPSGTGLDLLRTLRSKNSNIDIILVTASKEAKTLKAALRGGIFDYILKPLTFDRLKETLTNYQKHSEKLKNIMSINQCDVDSIIPKMQNNANKKEEERLPKGIDSLTLKRIRNIFNSPTKKSSKSAEEVGEIIGASRTTARRYLEYLTSINELQAEVNYGTVGRPERKYKVSQQ
ncbi:MAG: response regulator [Cellvibrionaceae bacterium]